MKFISQLYRATLIGLMGVIVVMGLFTQFADAAVTYSRTPSGFYVGDAGVTIDLHSDDVVTDFEDCVAVEFENQFNATYVTPYQSASADMTFNLPPNYMSIYRKVGYVASSLNPTFTCDDLNADIGSESAGIDNEFTLEQIDLPNGGNNYWGNTSFDRVSIFSTFPEVSGGSGTTTNIINFATTTVIENPHQDYANSLYLMLATMGLMVWIIGSRKRNSI